MPARPGPCAAGVSGAERPRREGRGPPRLTASAGPEPTLRAGGLLSRLAPARQDYARERRGGWGLTYQKPRPLAVRAGGCPSTRKERGPPVSSTEAKRGLGRPGPLHAQPFPLPGAVFPKEEVSVVEPEAPALVGSLAPGSKVHDPSASDRWSRPLGSTPPLRPDPRPGLLGAGVGGRRGCKEGTGVGTVAPARVGSGPHGPAVGVGTSVV